MGVGVSTLLLSACLTTAQNPQPLRFEGARAFGHLEQLVAIGPRPSGSEGATKARAYIRRELAAVGLKVDEQAFDARTPHGILPMINLRATVPGPGSGPRVIVAGHYDTKLFPGFRFVGANDGGSSTAFLLELARVLQSAPQTMTVELLFLDGEEAVVEWQGDDHTYGSRHYVKTAQQDGTLDQIGALVLVDMIGERNPRFLRETHSTPWLTDLVWSRARALGRREFVEQETAVEDDHLPFLAAGVPAVDIIDLDYPAWHTADDTLDQVSAESLQVVGDVVLAVLPEIQSRLQKTRR